MEVVFSQHILPVLHQIREVLFCILIPFFVSIYFLHILKTGFYYFYRQNPKVIHQIT